MIVPARRKLFGGDQPADYVGTNLQLLGGWNYGYRMPKSPIKSEAQQTTYLWKLSMLGFSSLLMQLLGNLTVNVREALWHFALAAVQNEVLGYTGMQNPRPLRRDPATGEATVEPLYDEPKRLISGTSYLVNFLAGYAFYHWAIVGTKLGWLAFMALGVTVWTDLSLWWADINRVVQEESQVNHYVHLLGFIGGTGGLMMLRWVGSYFVRLTGRGLKIPGQFVLGVLWTLGNYVYDGVASAELGGYDFWSD